MEQEVTLAGALGLIFTQKNRDVAAVTGWNYNTITSTKYRLKRGKVSYEKQEELVLEFGFRKVGEFRYKFPFRSVKTTINQELERRKITNP